jgi:hypothetical protein
MSPSNSNATADVVSETFTLDGQLVLLKTADRLDVGDIASGDGLINTLMFRTVDAPRMTRTAAGNVGIGLMEPSARLHVAGAGGNIAAELRGGLRLESSGDQAIADIRHQNNGSAETTDRVTYFLQGSSLPTAGWAFRETDGGDGTSSTVMKIQSNGNVGIGTTSPSAKLHVSGNVAVDGNIAAKYQDVAEWVDATDALPAGSVVSIAGGARDAVRASTNAYDTGSRGRRFAATRRCAWRAWPGALARRP